MNIVKADDIARAAMLALAVAMGIGRFAFTPLLPMMQHDYQLSVADGSWLATANYLGYLVGALAALAMPVAAPAAIGGGMLAIGLATLAMGFTQEYALWLFLRGIAGIASAWVMIYVSSWSLGQLTAMAKPDLSGRIFAGVGLGILAAGLASLAMMASQWSAAAAWIALGVSALLVAATVLRTFVMPTSARQGVAESARRDLFRWNGDALRLVGCFATSGFGYIIPATFLPAMAREVMADPVVFGWSWPVFGAAAMLSTLAVPGLRGVGHRRRWISSQLLMAAGVAVPVLWHGMAAFIVSGLLVGGTFMVITMAALSEAKAIAGAHAVGLLSAMTAAFAVGQLLGPVSVRLLVNAGRGFDLALLVASGVLVAGSYLLTRRPHECARSAL